MNGKVRGSEGRTFLLPLLGVLITSVLVGFLVRGVGDEAGKDGNNGNNGGVAESTTVLPFGG
jgi:hypothetical protein